MRNFAQFVLCSLALLCSTADAQTSVSFGKIAICEDGSEWPPYTYFERREAKKTERIVGFAVDVVHDIFSRHGIAYSLELIPWARCQAEVKLGKNYQMALNLSYSEERSRSYLLSRPYYQTTNYYFYSRRQYPHGLLIASAADLKKYAVCGLLGYNYAGYGLKAGEVDQQAKDFPMVIAKLHNRRCDLFVEKLEIMAGFLAIGETFTLDKDLGRAAIPGMESAPFHMAISPLMPQAALLRKLLDAELTQMENSGKLKALWQKYASE